VCVGGEGGEGGGESKRCWSTCESCERKQLCCGSRVRTPLQTHLTPSSVSLPPPRSLPYAPARCHETVSSVSLLPSFLFCFPLLCAS
jgi:hypothetical protein